MLKTDPDLERILDALFSVIHSQDNNKSVTTPKEDTLEDFLKNCIKAVKLDGLMLQYIQQDMRVPELCELAVSRNAKALEFVPEKLRTISICLNAVKKNPDMIKFVPENLRSFCETQIKFQDIKPSFRKRFLKIVKAIFPGPQNQLSTFKKQLDKEGVSQEVILEEFKKLNRQNKQPDICRNALNKDIRCFEFIPENIKTPDMCRKAVREKGSLLAFVPEHLKTDHLCTMAVVENWTSLQFVPNKFKPQLVEIAVKQNGKALQYIPEKLRTKQLCLLAILKNKEAIQYVPKTIRSKVLLTARQFYKEKRQLTIQDLGAFLERWPNVASHVLKPAFLTSITRNEQLNAEMTDQPKPDKSEILKNGIKKDSQKEVIDTILKRRPEQTFNSKVNGQKVQTKI